MQNRVDVADLTSPWAGTASGFEDFVERNIIFYYCNIFIGYAMTLSNDREPHQIRRAFIKDLHLSRASTGPPTTLIPNLISNDVPIDIKRH